MTMLKFESRNVYGKRLLYPMNDAARAIVDLTGRKCLKVSEVAHLRTCFSVEVDGFVNFLTEIERVK